MSRRPAVSPTPATAPATLTWAEAGFYVAATLALTWPVARHPMALLGAPVGPGDPYLNLWILGWDLRTITQDPLAVLSGRIFQANIFHPVEFSLAFSDHLIPQAIALWPIWAVSGNLVLCYNALLLLSLAGSALAMHALAFQLTGSRWGARVAAVAWAFWPYRFAHLLHVQLQSLYLLPLVFLFLHRLVARPRVRDAAALGAFGGLQVASSVYYGVIGTLAAALGALVLPAAAGSRRVGAIAVRLALAAVVALTLALPGLWPYWRVQQAEGFGRNLYEASQHSATAASYGSVPPGNLLYGRTGWLRPGPNRPEGPERELFPGALVIVLAVGGAIRARRSGSWPMAACAGTVALAGLALSLGPDGFRAIYAALHRGLFGFQAIRAPARFGVLVMFGLALLASLGARELAGDSPSHDGTAATPGRSRRRRGVWMVAITAGMLAEYANVPVPTFAAPPARTPVGQWLREAGGPGAVVRLPLEVDAGNTMAMLESLEHGRPIVNGYSGQRPGLFMALVDSLNQFPSVESLWTLRDLGVRFVVTGPRGPHDPGGAAEWGAAGMPVVERVRFGADRILELVWTPEAEARWPRPDAPPPPPPGDLSVGRFEEAVYRVEWLGGAHMPGVSAGRATLRAVARDAGWRFSVGLRTASWVSRFFEADDLLTTAADDQLRPLVHTQHIREGHRRLDRQTDFDREHRVVRIDGTSLPMDPSARDPLTALYYLRSLRLTPGSAITFPVSEGGRRLTVEVKVGPVETIRLGGRSIEAQRLDPVIRARVERRRPITATVWLSRDRLNLPLRIEVSAGFGDFRIELESHRIDEPGDDEPGDETARENGVL